MVAVAVRDSRRTRDILMQLTQGLDLGRVNQYLEDLGFRKAVFLNVSVKSRVAQKNDKGASTTEFEISVLDTSELSQRPPGEGRPAWIDKISTNVLDTNCKISRMSSGNESIALQISNMMAPIPRNVIAECIGLLQEQIQASPNVRYVLVSSDADADVTKAIKQRTSKGASK